MDWVGGLLSVLEEREGLWVGVGLGCLGVVVLVLGWFGLVW